MQEFLVDGDENGRTWESSAFSSSQRLNGTLIELEQVSADGAKVRWILGW